MRYWKTSEVAEYLGLSRDTVRKLRELPATCTPGGHRRYDPVEVKDYREKFQEKFRAWIAEMPTESVAIKDEGKPCP